MTLYNAKCPGCGHINKKMDLWDSEGFMECEQCFEIIQFMHFQRDYETSVFGRAYSRIADRGQERRLCECI